MTQILNALESYLSDPGVLVLWVGIVIVFAITCFPYQEKPRNIKVSKLKLSKERREMTIRDEWSRSA